MITARLALEQGRDVLVYRSKSNCSGNDKLIQEGAIVIESLDNLYEYIDSIHDINTEVHGAQDIQCKIIHLEII